MLILAFFVLKKKKKKAKKLSKVVQRGINRMGKAGRIFVEEKNAFFS